MKRTSALAVMAPLALLLALAACGRRSSIYAERSIPIAASAASAETTPRFVGRWAASMDKCRDAMVLEPKSLKTDGSNCDFDKVDSNPAGYTVTAVCHSKAGMRPSRLTIVAPDKVKISLLTISGGPFKDAVPLQRCAAE